MQNGWTPGSVWSDRGNVKPWLSTDLRDSRWEVERVVRKDFCPPRRQVLPFRDKCGQARTLKESVSGQCALTVSTLTDRSGLSSSGGGDESGGLPRPAGNPETAETRLHSPDATARQEFEIPVSGRVLVLREIFLTLFGDPQLISLLSTPLYRGVVSTSSVASNLVYTRSSTPTTPACFAQCAQQ